MFIPKTYTVESVTSGHPDKVCDQISDAILDEIIAQDETARVAIECLGAHGKMFIGGEVTTSANFDPRKIAREVYEEIGYKNKLRIYTDISKQSPDIAQGVNTGGAGDQGIMYGYATNETPEMMPKGVVLVHKLTKGLEDLRKSSKLPWLKPDGKAQVTIKNGKVDTVLVSTQHDKRVTQKEIRKALIKELIKPIGLSNGVKVLVNPTGKFVSGGFEADTGLTGRKIMVDTYGGIIPHGGGCFSGKDPTKVDRSAAYMARFTAKNLVNEGLGKKILVSVSYAIGKAEPLMVSAVNEKGKEVFSKSKKDFDFRPLSIIKNLDLRKPIYKNTAAYGHFGRNGFTWEEVY